MLAIKADGVEGCRNSNGSHTSTIKPARSKADRSSSARKAVSCSVTCLMRFTAPMCRSAQTWGLAMLGSEKANRPPGRSSLKVAANVLARFT